jgi:diphthamide synthase (EF-2-diphthine--ammonia ligase)
MARDFLGSGFQSVVTCVDSHVLDDSFVGRAYDEEFLARLPDNVDPCGENGEFHSFVHAGPTLRNPILHRPGEVVFRDKRYYFCDLLPDAGRVPS